MVETLKGREQALLRVQVSFSFEYSESANSSDLVGFGMGSSWERDWEESEYALRSLSALMRDHQLGDTSLKLLLPWL